MGGGAKAGPDLVDGFALVERQSVKSLNDKISVLLSNSRHKLRGLPVAAAGWFPRLPFACAGRITFVRGALELPLPHRWVLCRARAILQGGRLQQGHLEKGRRRNRCGSFR